MRRATSAPPRPAATNPQAACPTSYAPGFLPPSLLETAGAPPRVARASPGRSARSAARFAGGAEAGCLLPAVEKASGLSRTSRSIASANTKRPMIRACCRACVQRVARPAPRTPPRELTAQLWVTMSACPPGVRAASRPPSYIPPDSHAETRCDQCSAARRGRVSRTSSASHSVEVSRARVFRLGYPSLQAREPRPRLAGAGTRAQREPRGVGATLRTHARSPDQPCPNFGLAF